MRRSLPNMQRGQLVFLLYPVNITHFTMFCYGVISPLRNYWKKMGSSWIAGAWLALAIWSGGLSLANPIYVSPAGDDQAPGTAQAPVQTLARALTLAAGGGHIILAPGTYREGELTMQAGGTLAQPLRIEGAGADQTIIRGSRVVTGWVSHGGGVWKKLGWTTNSQQVFCDGVHLQQIGARSTWHSKALWDGKPTLPPVGASEADLFPGSFFHDGDAQVLYVYLPGGSNPNQHLMEASYYNWVLDGKNSQYVQLKHLCMGHTNGTYNGGKGKVLILGGQNWTVDSCIIEYGDFACISASGQNHIIRNSLIRFGGDLGIDMNNSDAAHNWAYYNTAPHQNTLIEGCTLTEHNYRNFDVAWHSGGMKVIPAIRGVTVRGNTFGEINGPAIWFDHPLGENVIESNFVSNCTKGVFYELAENEETVSFAGKICNNTIVNTSQQGIYVSASSGVEVTRNTVLNCWVGIVLHGMPRGNFRLEDNFIEENIVLAGSHADMIIFAGEGAERNTVNRNFYVTGVAWTPGQPPRTGIRVGVVTGKGYSVNHTSLGSLQDQTPYEDGGQTGDPEWADPGNYDFAVSPGSPAEGHGAEDVCCCSALQGFNPFPVELLDFGAVPGPGRVLLHWETAMESQNAGFSVERSRAGDLYTRIGWVPGVGEAHRYRLADERPLAGTVYYRLVQHDIDGRMTPYPAVAVTLEEATGVQIRTQGALSSGEGLPLAVWAPGDQAAHLFLMNMAGQVLWQAVHPPSRGWAQYEVGPGYLPPGCYLIGAQEAPGEAHRIRVYP